MRDLRLSRGSVLRLITGLAAALAFAQCDVCGQNLLCGAAGADPTTCKCASGTKCSDNNCYDLTSDPTACGACFAACGPSQTCVNSKCVGQTDGSPDAPSVDAGEDVETADVTTRDAPEDGSDAGEKGDSPLDAPPDAAMGDATGEGGGACNSEAFCAQAGFPGYVCCQFEAGSPTCVAPLSGSPECLAAGSFCGPSGTQLCTTNQECDPSCDSGTCSCSSCNSNTGQCLPF
jgi:hypothetical protein